MDYDEAYDALEDFVTSEGYEEFVDDLPSTAEVNPDLETFGDRAVFYVQVEDSFKGEYERKVLAEYRDGEIGPVPFDEEELAEGLQGRGEIKIDESILEPRDINFPGQRKAR
ncbi:MAG: hypothetical protein ABEK04_05365 [Candidatus Nanohalobium sp.]